MSKIFNSPVVLGFDHLERIVDHIIKNHRDSFPPYNIEIILENRLQITLAVAGFLPENLSVCIEDNQLVIRGQNLEDNSRVFLHKGIATRSFQKNFLLADGMDVIEAKQDKGLLFILLERPKIINKVREISITNLSNNLVSAKKIQKLD